ncbi:anthranilate synthase component II [uncultured Robinsoniella sp.]|uniref:anthranilate synthase component II n=1 Tax=uncultured Robinsoniella sp. TaxID=904190 RepID=UPI00374F2362
MFLCIDNYDSFVYNLSAYFEELGQEILVVRNDKVRLEELSGMKPEGIIISPGPKNPMSAGLSNEIVRKFINEIPILGVCLGHQVIGYSFGADIVKGKRPMHGKVTKIRHSGKGIFHGLPREYGVTRYHSLVIDRKTLPADFQVDAWTEDGDIMAISHREAPVFGVQFHPEAVLTDYGHELLGNFITISKEWRCSHA